MHGKLFNQHPWNETTSNIKGFISALVTTVSVWCGILCHRWFIQSCLTCYSWIKLCASDLWVYSSDSQSKSSFFCERENKQSEVDRETPQSAEGGQTGRVQQLMQKERVKHLNWWVSRALAKQPRCSWWLWRSSWDGNLRFKDLDDY